jgi:lipoprotein NlpI
LYVSRIYRNQRGSFCGPQASCFWRRLLVLVCIAASCAGFVAAAETVDELLTQAQTAQRKGNLADALILATKAANLGPTNAQCYYVRGRLYAEDRQSAKAVADFDKALALEPRAAEIYHLRGLEQFKLSRFKESCADFDKFLGFAPQRAAQHWQRGISCYYAGRYEEGRKQFELHQTVNPNDVENAVWHFLCVARSAGLAKARESLLPISGDSRVPMMQIYSLFAGKARAEDVLAAAKGGYSPTAQINHQLFYAHLYLGLYYDVSGNEKLAAKHIRQAADQYKVDDYMGEVARVHAGLLKGQ